MKKLSEVLNSTDLEQSAKDVITNILGRLDDKIVSSFIENLKITNRKVAGTCYAGVKENISRGDFVRLYEALGYNFATEALWDNKWCTYKDGCVSKNTFTCNDDFCPKHG